MVMRSPCAGDALDPPLWKVPNKALSFSLGWQVTCVPPAPYATSLSLQGEPADTGKG